MKDIRLPFFDQRPRGWTPDEPPNLDGVTDIALDGEFDGLDWHKGSKPCGWSVAWWDGDRLLSRYLPHRQRGGGNLSERAVTDWLQTLRNKRISNHSTKIDIHMARVDGADLEAQGCTFHDVAHSAALLNDHRLRFNLHELAEDELKSGKLDPGVPKDQIYLAPAWQIAPYAKRDTTLVLRLRKHYAPLLVKDGLERVQALEDAVIPTVVEMERNGVPYDQEMLDAWLVRLDEIEVGYLWALQKSFGKAIDPGKKADLAWLWSRLGLEPGKKTRDNPKPGQAVVYDSWAYEFVAAAADLRPELRPLERVMALRSLRSKVFTPLKEDGISGLYTPTYHQLRSVTNDGEVRGVVSGRFSAPLIHQLPGKPKYDKKYGTFGERSETFWARELFREVDGFWFNSDARQIQFRIFAHVSQSKRLIDMYRANPLVSGHKIVAGWLLPIRPDLTETEVKIGNFTVLFAGGVNATMSLLKCSRDEALRFREAYFEAFPEAQETSNRVRDIAERRGWVRSVLGRRARFPKGRWTDKYGKYREGRLATHTGLNRVCQLNESDVLKTKMVLLHRERKALGYTPRVSLHDEVNGRLDDPAKASDVLEILNEQSIPFDIPILWGGGVVVGRSRQSWAGAK